MPGDQDMKTAIQGLIRQMMERVMHRVLYEDPFLPERHHADKPLYAALVPDEIFKGAHFERRFVTPFGNAWEKLAVVAAEHGLGKGTQGVMVEGMIRQGRLQRIQEILNRLEHSAKGKDKIRPNWQQELDYILQGKGELIPVRVMTDLFVEDTVRREKYAFELKAPLPNSDITKVSKEKLLKLYCMETKVVDEAYYALPYNPYGRKEDYAWSFPARWFNMKEDAVVLIGDEFWEKIGGVGTYQVFIEAINEIGMGYKERIYREFLGIEPPPESLKSAQW